MKSRTPQLILCAVLLSLTGCMAPSYKNCSTEKPEIPVQETLLETQGEQTARIVNQLQGGTPEQPVILINPYGLSPLSAVMQFETETETAVQVIVRGRTPQTDLTFTQEPARSHQIMLTGLLADQPTTVQVIIDGDQVIQHTLQADPVPEDALRAEVTIPARNPEANRLIFTTPSSTGYASAYDANGDLRWILNVMMLWDLNLLDNGKITLSTNRLLDSPYYTTGFLTMDLLGHIETEYDLPGGYHHDLDQLPNGNYLVASDDFNGSTVEDVIVEVDQETGEIVRQFDLKTILPQDQGKSLNWTAKDWFHNNSVDYNAAQNTLTVSGRHQDAVAVIDYDTQQLKHIIGSPQGWEEDMQSCFLNPVGEPFEWQWAQHAATWISDTQLMLFDNGMYRSKTEAEAILASENYSRMVIYEIDEEQNTIRQVEEYGKERGSVWYSPYISDADQLGERHYLITSGGISWLNGQINNQPGSLTEYDKMEAYITEIDQGEAIFELKLPANIYRSECFDVSKGTMTALEEGKRLGNLGETRWETMKSRKLKLNFKQAEVLDDQTRQQVSLMQEPDRLMVTATLNKHDNFDVLLVNDDGVRLYPVQTDTQPGMCVAVFNSPKQPETSTMIQSISLEGLEGTYCVFYLKNEVLIDSGQILNITPPSSPLPWMTQND